MSNDINRHPYRIGIGIAGFVIIVVAAFIFYLSASIRQSTEAIIFMVIFNGLLAFIGAGFIYRAFVGYPPAKHDSQSDVRVYTKDPPPIEGQSQTTKRDDTVADGKKSASLYE